MLKEKFKKILILSILSIMMFNFIGTNVVYADLDDELDAYQGYLPGSSSNDDGYVWGDLDAEQQAQQGDTSIITPGSTVDPNTGQVIRPSNGSTSTSTSDDPTLSTVSNKTQILKENEIAKQIGSGLSTIADGIVGIYTYFERLKIVILGGVLQFLGAVVGESAGSMNTGTVTFITPDDILFNKLAITDINFFNLTSFGTLNNQKALSGSDNPIKLLKQNVANWYMTIRTMAMIILAVILIYIGIRMVIASNPESKVNYKKMFMNWLVSFALLFLLHYIIILVININAVLVDMIASVGNSALGINDGFMSNYVSKLVLKSFMPFATISWSAAIVYFLIVALTFVFLIMYIKRMITIAFLILISPIITITYSIDKAGNGKAEAFSSWMKEFFHNVLIQPFHCIIYVAFVAISLKMLQGTGTLASAILVIVTMFFILEAENLIKQIFGISSKSTGSALATAAVLSTAYEKFKPDKKDKKQVPSNVAQGNANNAKASAAAAKAGNKPSMTASNNMAATNRPTEADRKNEELSRILSGETGAVGYDHYQTMNYEQDKNEDLSKIMSGGSGAEADDYEALMNPEPRRNRVYGILNKQEDNNNNIVAENATAQADTIADVNMPHVKNNTPKSDFEQLKEGVKGFGKMAGKSLWEGNKATSGLAGMAIGGALAGLSGQNIANTIGSMAVGKKIQDHAEEKAGTAYENAMARWQQELKEREYKNNQRTLATAFSNFKGESEYNQTADIQQARQYLGMPSDKIQDIEDKSVRQYVQALHAMRSINNKNFDEDANEKTIETMEKIINGEIQPNAE